MKRFEFRLQKILRLREYHEKQWEARLAEVNAECASVEAEIGKARDDRARVVSEGVPGDVDEMLYRERFVSFIDLELERRHNKLKENREKQVEVRDGYQQAAAARKALGKLKEKQAAEHHKVANRHEILVLDDIGRPVHRRSD